MLKLTAQSEQILNCKTHNNTENVTVDPSPLVHDVLDGDSLGSHDFTQLSNAAGPVAHGHFELHQATLGC